MTRSLLIQLKTEGSICLIHWLKKCVIKIVVDSRLKLIKTKFLLIQLPSRISRPSLDGILSKTTTLL